MDVHVHQVVSVTVKHHLIEGDNPFWVTAITIINLDQDWKKSSHVIKLFSNGIEKLIIQEEK